MPSTSGRLLDTWAAPPHNLNIQTGETHVWRIALDQPDAKVATLFALLSEDERRRVFRFHFDRDRRRFTVARGALRCILSNYLGAQPERLRFGYSEHGKPFLDTPLPGLDIRFNVSHSDELALVAVTVAAEVGVDVEKIRPDFAGLEIAERFFSPAEVKALRSLPIHLRSGAFFNCWTRKEAFVKATGRGLSFPLKAFDVTLAPGESPRLLRVENDDPARWSIFEVSPAPDFVGALVVESRDVLLMGWHWQA